MQIIFTAFQNENCPLSFRWAVFLCLLISSILPLTSYSQSKAKKAFVEEITQEEAVRRLEVFRSFRLKGDFAFQFELTHYPFRQDKVKMNGILLGSWNNGPLYRIHLFSDKKTYTYLLHNSQSPKVLRINEGTAQRLTPKEYVEELIPDRLISYFDLLMPYVFWQDFDYKGSTYVKGRPSQEFSMLPPTEFKEAYPELASVDIHLDNTYNALLRVQYKGPDGNTIRAIKNQTIKKLDGQWFLNRFDFASGKERTRFQVKEAALNLDLPQEWFSEDSLTNTVPRIEPGLFTKL